MRKCGDGETFPTQSFHPPMVNSFFSSESSLHSYRFSSDGIKLDAYAKTKTSNERFESSERLVLICILLI